MLDKREYHSNLKSFKLNNENDIDLDLLKIDFNDRTINKSNGNLKFNLFSSLLSFK